MSDELTVVPPVSSGGLTGAVRGPTPADQLAKRRTLDRAEADRASLVLRFPFLAQLAMNLELVPVVDFRVPTAATDGQHVWLSPEFMDSLTADERLFVLGHEVWHCALGHLHRQGDRDPDDWNLAIDHEANVLLGEEGLEIPRDAVLFAGWEGSPAEEIYEQLRVVPEEPRVDDSDEDVLEDLFRLYRAPVPQPPIDPVERGRFADVHDLPTSVCEAMEASTEVDLVVDPDFEVAAMPPPPGVWDERLVIAGQRAGGRSDATGPALSRLLEALCKPKVPWKEVLRQFVTSAYGGERRWLPPSRRHVSQGLYLPSRRSDMLRAVVAVDTSGSTDLLMEEFAAELVGLLDSFGRYQVTLICCDEEIRSVQKFDVDRPLTAEDLRFEGGWGTDFRPVFEWVGREEREAGVLVFLTDGEGPAPVKSPAVPVLWVLPPRVRPPAAWGQVTTLGLPDGSGNLGSSHDLARRGLPPVA